MSSVIKKSSFCSSGEKVPSIALVGCGDWGKNIARTLDALGALGVIIEHQKERGEAYAQTYKVPLVSFEQMLQDPKIEGVVLATPLSRHKEMAQQILEARKSVFIEKPVVSCIDDFDILKKKAAEKKVCVMGGHLLLYHPVFQEVCRLVQEGAIGEVRLVTSHRQNFGKFFPQEDVVWDFGPHDLSMIFAVLASQGVSFEDVSSVLTPLLVTHAQRDVAAITLRFPKNITAYAYMSRLSGHKEQRLSVYGTSGILEFDDTKIWDQKLKMIELGEDGETKLPIQKSVTYMTIPPGQPLKEEMKTFLKGIRGGDLALNHDNIKQVIGVLEKIT